MIGLAMLAVKDAIRLQAESYGRLGWEAPKYDIEARSLAVHMYLLGVELGRQTYEAPVGKRGARRKHGRGGNESPLD